MRKNQSKDIVLILFEGETDKNSLEYLLSKIVCNEKVKCKVCDGDLTTKRNAKPSNIEKYIIEKVYDFLNKSHGIYLFENIKLIVHVLDTDACGINSKKIIIDNKNEYIDDTYHSTDINNIINRNRQKLPIIKKLSTLNSITFNCKDNAVKPYIAYYMSRNLEDVLHNDPNINTVNGKIYYSDKFAIKYENDIYGFITFINSNNVGTKLNFSESWLEILKEENATKRQTNFNLFINDYIN